MRFVAKALPLIAVGLFVGGALMLGSGTNINAVQTSAGASPGLDYRSMFIGLLLGLALASMTQVQWLDLPRRVVVWILDNEQNMYRFGLAGVCLAVLIFY
jgi:hypothetical protein